MQQKITISFSIFICFSKWRKNLNLANLEEVEPRRCSEWLTTCIRMPLPILSRCQFHQRFYVQIFRTNVGSAAFSSYVLAFEKNLYEKCAKTMLMKLTVGLNFVNILHIAFMCSNPKSVKYTKDLTVFFTLLGSTSIKALCKLLVKLTLDTFGFFFAFTFEKL